MRGIANPLTIGPFSATLPDTVGTLDIPAQASGSGLLDTLLPWLVNVDVFMTPITHTNWNTNTVDTNHVYAGYRISSGAQNDAVGFDVVLSAGTWTFELIHAKDTDRGIYTVSLDGASAGTIDGYNASTSRNQRSQITGIAVATTGKKRLLLTMATKNGSSSSYYGVINHLQFKRTA